jgi:hypothetical protein
MHAFVWMVAVGKFPDKIVPEIDSECAMRHALTSVSSTHFFTEVLRDTAREVWKIRKEVMRMYDEQRRKLQGLPLLANIVEG